GTFDVTTLAQDTTPTAFTFTAQTGAALSSVATSDTITVAGINSAANISIAGGTYSKNGGAYTAVAGTVNNGDTVTLQQTSSASFSTLTTATLTIGGVAGTFDVTTLAQDTTPTAFTFTAQTGVALSSVATSDTLTVAGINSAANISIAGGTYSINGGGYTAVAGTVNNGDTVTLKQTSSGSFSTLTTATLTIGGVSATFSTTTVSAPVHGTCDSNNHGQTLTTVPSGSLCATGNPSSVDGTGPWSWTCIGSNGGNTASCSASVATYTLSYSAGANGSLTGTASQTVNYNATGNAVTAVPATGYHFVNWSDASTANPRTDNPVTANVTVTANFAIDSFTVTYNGNTNSGGIAPIDGSSHNYNTSVTVLGNTGALVKTGYTFAGWNTLANGTGTAYAVAATFTIAANTTLYAQWSALTYTVSYNGNGHTAGSAPADNNRYTTDSTVAVQAGAGTFAKTGHTFAGWNSAADGSGTPYSGSFAIGAANLTLYAQWSANTACGSAYGGTFITVPATGLCASGSASALSASGTGWTWTCTNGAATTNCSANTGTLSLTASGVLAFGKVSLNEQSTVQTLTVLNNGTMPVDIGQIAVTAGNPPFSLKSDACSNTQLAPGASCILRAVFAPTSNGVVTGTVSIPSNATAGALSTSLTGEGVTPASPLASVSAQALSFGSISVGSVSTEQAVTVKNTGTSDLVIGTVTLTGTEFVMTSNGCSGLTLAVNTSCILKTKFTPLSTGSKTGNINLPSNDPNAPSIDIALDGTGMTAPQPAISVSSDNISFAKVTVTGTATQTTTVTNQGTARLNIGAIAIAGTDLAHFGTANDTCSNTRVAAAASCTFDTTFTPGVPGSYTGVVTIPSDDPNTPAFNLSLDGTTGSLAGSDVNSTGATVKDLVVVDGLTSTGGLSVDKALSFTATGVAGSAEFTLTFDSLPANLVIYKIVGST
ncbi:MAG: choice-of-anchor D domain-containing protein, partial [Gallionella sp.]|nr:choice-of-anchor D domain-containing protein [Gallionella sp.]